MAKRRSPGEGSVVKVTRTTASGRTLVRYRASVLVDDDDGKRRITRTYPTRSEAAAALPDLRAEASTAKDESERPSLGSFLRYWLAESVPGTVAPNTLRGYEDAAAHLAPLYDVKLDELTVEQLEGCFNRMTSRKGKRDDVPAAPKTVRNVQIMLRRALTVAEERGYARRNVARLVPLRRLVTVEPEYLSPERARAILDAVKGDRYEAAYALSFMGLREGEVLGLAESDLHLDDEQPYADIRCQLAGSGSRAARVLLKNGSKSAAPVPLPPPIVEKLRAHLARNHAERPVAPLGGALLFVTPAGYAVNASWFTKHFQKLVARAGLGHMRLHDLRHGAASVLAAAGANPKVAQELLRHATPDMTLRVYTHVTATQKAEAAGIIGDLFEPVTPGNTPGNIREPVSRRAK